MTSSPPTPPSSDPRAVEQPLNHHSPTPPPLPASPGPSPKPQSIEQRPTSTTPKPTTSQTLPRRHSLPFPPSSPDSTLHTFCTTSNTSSKNKRKLSLPLELAGYGIKEGFQGLEYNYVEWPESHERTSIAREEAVAAAREQAGGERERDREKAAVWRCKRIRRDREVR